MAQTNMEDKKIVINAAQGVSVIHLLEGEAPKNFYPTKVKVSGNAHAVSDFIKGLSCNLDVCKVIITINADRLSIVLDSDPESENEGYIVTAKIEKFLDLQNFGINQEKFFSLKDLEKHIRMNRFYFADKDAHMALAGQLRSFKAKVDSDITQMQDQRGNKANAFNKTVTSDLAADFVLTIPIFKGGEPKTFRVEICYDVTDSAVRFWLESVELFELEKSMAETLLNGFKEEYLALGYTVICQ